MLVVSRRHARDYFRLSFLSALSAAYAITRGHYNLAAVPGGVWLTSMLYWCHPVLGWRRNLDMTYVALALLYQLWCARLASNALAYYLISVGAVGVYPVSCYYMKKGEHEIGHVFHCLVHILGNVGNFVLYSGDI